MRTIIFGVGGQTGSYLAEHLLEKGHEVIGVARRTSTPNTERLVNILDNPLFSLLVGDITDFGSVLQIIQEYTSDWVINLAAQSHVGTSFQQACSSMDITAKGCINVLEALRLCNSNTKMYQASSSEMFGKAYDEVNGDKFQDENTKFQPQSPYAVAKVAAHQFCQLYRHAYNMDIRCGILFNHCSERRGEEFVTRKITLWLGKFLGWKNSYLNAGFVNDKEEIYIGGRISRDQGFQFPKLRLGDLSASRDFGYAPDYVKAMTLIMEHDTPDDWVVSTGDTHTIEEFLGLAFELAGLGSWKDYVVIDDKFKRPAEVPFLKGDSSRIRNELGWKPKVSFNQLVKRMVDHDINKYKEKEYV